MTEETRKRLRWAAAGAITLLVVTLIGLSIWFIIVLQPADRDAAAAISFDFTKGTSTADLAEQLHDRGIVRSQAGFYWYVTLTGRRRTLQAGHYEFHVSDSTPEIADKLARGEVVRNTLVVPEGSTLSKIQVAAQETGISLEAFDEAIQETYPNDFLAARPAGVTSLEGYLFPDSYEVAKPVRPHAVIQSMLDNFAAKVAQTDVVTAYAAEGLTLHQGLALASIVEREAGKAEDRPIIAQVFLKRLKEHIPLQSDVTVEYAAEITGKPFNLKLDSRYNTYAYSGIPPGPICNPGIDAMKAVAHPASTDYLYFLADKQGKVHYAKTAEEHNANIQKYLR